MPLQMLGQHALPQLLLIVGAAHGYQSRVSLQICSSIHWGFVQHVASAGEGGLAYRVHHCTAAEDYMPSRMAVIGRSALMQHRMLGIRLQADDFEEEPGLVSDDSESLEELADVMEDIGEDFDMEPYDPLDADEIAALEAQTDRMRRRDEWSEEELEADAQAEAAREAERRKLLGADELEDDEDDESGQMETVKMTTPLGNTLDNLEIFPGPPVPAQVDWTDDARPLYVFLGMYPPRMMPTPPLVESFVTWLNGTADLGLAGYLLSQQHFDLSGLGTDYTDAELEEYDARAADDVDAEDVPQMLEQQMQFVNANLVVTRHKDIEAARQWAHDDPLNEHNGYARTSTHRWMRSNATELNVPEGDGCVYLVYCLDKEGGSSLRQSTRPAHLAWLQESGRVHDAGPLLEADDGESVGTMLIVRGDGVDEVRQWVQSDPYATNGLFEQVVVAPIVRYNVHIDEFGPP